MATDFRAIYDRVIEHHPGYNSPAGSPGYQACLLWADRLRGLESEQPLFFHRLEDFGEDRRLKTEVEPGTPAQHRSPRKHLP